jgi:hypothetical protein
MYVSAPARAPGHVVSDDKLLIENLPASEATAAFSSICDLSMIIMMMMMKMLITIMMI